MGRGFGSYIRKADRDRLQAQVHCAYCKQLCHKLTIEHIVSLEKGGDSQPHNLTVACPRCNSLKQAFPLDEFLIRLDSKRSLLAEQVRKHCRRYKRLKRRRVLDPKGKSDMIYLKHKIRDARYEHSYFSQIANSIITSSYIIHHG